MVMILGVDGGEYEIEYMDGWMTKSKVGEEWRRKVDFHLSRIH
jgi:hypothetical protein